MRKYLVVYAVAVTALLVWGVRHYRAENRRLAQNQTALAGRVKYYRTRLGEEVASVQALRFRCGEFEELRAADAERIRALGIKLRRVEAASKAVTETSVEVRAPLRDTVVVRDTVCVFRWCDAWTTVEGFVDADSVACRVTSVDTLRQIVHRVPRRFLFIRWGTKALRQEITSANPHTRIVFTEYVRIEK